jgi:hypothetical protein
VTLMDRTSAEAGWRQLHDQQARARDAVSELLDQPSTQCMDRLRSVFARYLRSERLFLDDPANVHDAWRAELEEQHARVAAAFNSVLWETPGSAALWQRAMHLRHVLLRQIDVCQRASQGSARV